MKYTRTDVKIRELEAALETKTTWWLKEKARAEKAEARVEKAIAALDVEHQEVIELKGRIAELERIVGEAERQRDKFVWTGEKWTVKPAPASEGHEREAD